MKGFICFILMFGCIITACDSNIKLHKIEHSSLFSNANFKYDVVLASKKGCDEFFRIKDFEIIIDEKYIIALPKFSNRQIINMLESEHSDFAMNIVLFKIYGDGYVPTYLIDNISVEEWRKKHKNHQVSSWKNEFMNN